MTAPKTSGFTLIELSIVLVIIGLLVGGVLVGRDLIEAAAMRKAVSQLEQYATAANTFKAKYGCLPADCNTVHLKAFGFSSPDTLQGYNAVNDPRDGNEDGLVGDWFYSGPTNGQRAISIETRLFFLHLQQATLLSDPLQRDLLTCLTSGSCSYSTADGRPTAFPKLSGSDFGVFPVAFNGSNYWRTGFYQTSHLPYNGVGYQRFSYTPVQSLYIDGKIDDGKPVTGRATATGNVNTYTDPWMFVTQAEVYTANSPAYITAGATIDGAIGADNAICFNSGTNVYNSSNSQKICNLAIKANY